ncbi:MAG: hypothetical protein KIS66_10705 [Fimbriimonadaceae bacterium]|nr:hypothetical protein [Fimbriimonadaceae bacterium]
MFPFLPVLMLLFLQGSPTPNVGTAQVRLQVALCALQSELTQVESDSDPAGEDDPDRPTVRAHRPSVVSAGLALRALAMLLGDSPLPGREPPACVHPGDAEPTVPTFTPPDDSLGRSGFVSAWMSRAGPA